MKRSRATRKRTPPDVPTPVEHRRVLLELQVHQEELRQQNDDLRNSQLELEAARDRYSDLYDLGPLPHLTLNKTGTVVEANETCLAFLGLPHDRLVPRPFASLVPPAWRPIVRPMLLALRRKPTPVVRQIHLLAGAGEVPVELHIRPTAREQFYTAIVDLSDRQRMEQERRSLLVDVEVARSASAARDQFLAGLSHELRTPLTPVIAALSGLEPRLARGGLGPHELRDFVSMLRRNLAYEVRLIDELLDASRLAFGKLTLELQSVDVHDVVAEAVSMVTAEAAGNGIEVRIQLAASKHYVKGDPARLRQVFWNLLRNAIKFTPGGGSVTVRSRSAAGVVTVEVRDTGIGIAPADLPRVFERFAQGPAGARGGGLGLGLTIVHGIVEAHGGRVRAESAGLGRGARFLVELASAGRAVLPTQPALPRTAAQAVARAAGPGGRHILLVDDHEETAAILADLLRGQGYQVTVAHTMSGALEAAESGLDLLITDIGLPDGSGHELAERLRRRFSGPAIALTGYGQQDDLARSREAGFARHLVKPVEFPKLIEAIREVTARSG
jgi:signal transduction histidine kinase/CheY-like chemotaxis protein